MLLEAWEASGHRAGRVATMLGVSRNTAREWLAELGLRKMPPASARRKAAVAERESARIAERNALK